MAGWRFYARRPSGLWLHTDVPLVASITEEITGPGLVTGTIPAGLDVARGDDGRPLWVEKGTKLYAEQDGQLEWCGVCTYTSSNPTGRTLEFVGLSGALQWMPFDSEYGPVWEPDPFDVVAAMLDHAQGYPNGDLGLTLKRVTPAGRGVGDLRPPERPEKPVRRAGETAEDYDDRLLPWEMAVDEWEAAYGARQAYRLGWWEAPMVGEELDELAGEVPFEYREVHRGTALDATHELEVGGRLGVRRHDIRFVDGENLAEALRPETDADEYANDVIALGAGEGRKMSRARVASSDPTRFRAARFVAAKHVRNESRLRSIAQRVHDRTVMLEAGLESVRVWDIAGYAPVTTLRAGDEVWIQSDYTTPAFGAWRRILSITRTTDSAEVELRFKGGAG